MKRQSLVDLDLKHANDQAALAEYFLYKSHHASEKYIWKHPLYKHAFRKVVVIFGYWLKTYSFEDIVWLINNHCLKKVKFESLRFLVSILNEKKKKEARALKEIKSIPKKEEVRLDESVDFRNKKTVVKKSNGFLDGM